MAKPTLSDRLKNFTDAEVAGGTPPADVAKALTEAASSLKERHGRKAEPSNASGDASDKASDKAGDKPAGKAS